MEVSPEDESNFRGSEYVFTKIFEKFSGVSVYVMMRVETLVVFFILTIVSTRVNYLVRKV